MIFRFAEQGGRDVRNVGPTDAVVAAIASLEADPVTNAGFGSALTLHGFSTVICFYEELVSHSQPAHTPLKAKWSATQA
jgi:hypothetical protein